MPLRIRFQGGPRAGQVVDFDDDVTEIIVGRDAERCKVCFPPDDDSVGREHFSIEREPGGYRLQANGRNPVLLDGKAVSGHKHLALDRESEIRLGPAGATLLVTPTLATTSSGDKLGKTRVVGPPQRRTTTIWRELRSGSRRATAIAVMSLLVGGGALVAAKIWYDKTHHDVAGLGQDMELMGLQVSSVASNVEDLSKLNGDQRKALDSLADEVKRKQQTIADVAARIGPSVYLVTLKMPDGSLRPLGTSWVVDRERGLLATNVHIAEIHRNARNWLSSGPNDLPLVVCSPGDDSRNFEVLDVTMHPGYADFNKLWRRFDPSRPIGERKLETIDKAAPSCDVALLHVAEADQLAPALKLASDETLAALEPGTPIALAGYPIEGIALGGVNVESPAPEVDVGVVRAVTDYFGSPERSAEKLLIHHSAGTAGGASGSPLVNLNGEVIAVHNANNVIGEIDNVRVISGANIRYSQRVDLVRELLGGESVYVPRQAQRLQDWEERIAKFYAPGRLQEIRWALDDSKKTYMSDLEMSGVYRVTQQKIVVPKPDRSIDGDDLVMRVNVALPSAGFYMISALGQINDSVELIALSGDRRLYGASPSGAAALSRVTFETTEPGTWELTARAGASDAVEFDVTQFTRTATNTDPLHQKMVDAWTDGKFSAELVGQTSGTLAKPNDFKTLFMASATWRFDISQPGKYLVTMVGENEGLLWLTVDGDNEPTDPSQLLASQSSVKVARTVATPITGMLTSLSSDVGYTLHLYRAREEPEVLKRSE